MNIKNPIYYVKVEGDIRYIVYTLPNIIGVKYNTIDNKTEIIVRASNEDETGRVIKYFYNLHEDLPRHKKTYKREQVEVSYLKSFTI